MDQCKKACDQFSSKNVTLDEIPGISYSAVKFLQKEKKGNVMFELNDLQEYFDNAKSHKIGFKGKCHDCGKKATVDLDLDDSLKLTAQVGPTPADTAMFMKCEKCFKACSALRNFMPCDVYSRAIGYLRPVSAWNDGKQAEFVMRKTFSVDKGESRPNKEQLNGI
jgi:hypothetical protein